MGFIYERNLPHQVNAIQSVLSALNSANINQSLNKAYNPLLKISDKDLRANLLALQKAQNIEEALNPQSRIFDISMETGTGKTYTYTKMALELCREFGLRKFIIIVPTLAIKANALNFLRTNATREHFESEYGLGIITNAIEAKKSSPKSTKKLMPSGLRDFIKNDNPKEVHFLIINSAMLTASSMNEDYDSGLLDEFSNPYDALNAINAVCIIDEPHKFKESNKAWAKILNTKERAINPQIIFRYGATFDERAKGQKYYNLIYQLNAISAFNENLVKGVEITICEASGNEKQKWAEFVSIENNQAKFILKEQGKDKAIKQVALSVGENLSVIDENLAHLCVEKISKTSAVLNTHNDDEGLKKGDKIPLNAYLPQMQTQMLKEALQRHFELEKRLMQSQTKIKPLTLFFIEELQATETMIAQRRFCESSLKISLKA